MTHVRNRKVKKRFLEVWGSTNYRDLKNLSTALPVNCKSGVQSGVAHLKSPQSRIPKILVSITFGVLV